MVIIKVIITLMISINIYAMEGRIIALEAPLFKEPNINSQIISYAKKGDQIYLHDKHFKRDFEDTILEKKYAEKFPDSFLDQAENLSEDSEFYLAIAAAGKKAYVLRRHIEVIYKDPREFNNKISGHDDTDYRIAEPLDKNYPFRKTQERYRGQLQLGLGRSNASSYPYIETTSSTSSGFATELNFVYTKEALSQNLSNQIYYGGLISLYLTSLDSVLENQGTTQDHTTLSLGPYLSYEIYTHQKYSLTTYLNFLIHVHDEVKVTINESGDEETRSYQSELGITPNLGMLLTFKKVIGSVDLGVGTNVKINSPKTYKASSQAKYDSYWTDATSDDSFNQKANIELSYLFELRSYY